MYGPPEQQTLEGVPIVSPITGTEKRCKGCGKKVNKSDCCPSEFKHENPRCRKCEAKRRREWREENPEKVKDYCRASREKHKDKMREYHKKYSNENRIVKNAQQLSYNALKKGKIKKLPCAVCGSHESQKHHPDYSKPLDIIWLCSRHHMRLHLWEN